MAGCPTLSGDRAGCRGNARPGHPVRASSSRPQQVGVNGTIDFVDCQASPLQPVNEEGGGR